MPLQLHLSQLPLNVCHIYYLNQLTLKRLLHTTSNTHSKKQNVNRSFLFTNIKYCILLWSRTTRGDFLSKTGENNKDWLEKDKIGTTCHSGRTVFKLWTCMTKAQQDLDSANWKWTQSFHIEGNTFHNKVSLIMPGWPGRRWLFHIFWRMAF